MTTNSKEYMRMYMRKYRQSTKFELIEKLGYHCIICGCGKPVLLQFHHANGYSGKLHPNGSRGGHENLRDIQKLLKEGRKDEIVLLCKRCHEHVHRKKLVIRRRNSY